MDYDEDAIVKKVLQKLNSQKTLEPLDMTQVVGFHTHNGIDSPQINYKDITGKSINYNQISGTPSTRISGPVSWNFTGTFSSDALSVKWTSGTLIVPNAGSYSISSGTTGAFSAITYIYFDSSVSTTVFQSTTTASNAVGSGIILIGVAYPGIANPQGAGVTMFNDDFNSYSNGTLNGQGGWTTTGTDTLFVQGTTTYEGAKAIYLNGDTNLESKRTGSVVTDGQLTFYGRVHGTDPVCFFSLVESSSGKIAARVYFGGSASVYPLRVDYFDGLSEYILGGFSVDTWFAVQFQWRSSDKKFRVRLNGGAWSDWSSNNGFNTGLDRVVLTMSAIGTNNIYIDTIQENLFYENPTFQIFGGSGGVLINENNIANIENFTQQTSGSGAPASTPSYLGQMYVDILNIKVYVSTGTTSSSDWTILN